VKKLLEVYEKFLRRVMEYCLGTVLIVIGVGLCFIVWLQIFARTFIDVPPSWTEEISRLAFVWFGILASIYTLWKREHMPIDFIYLKCGPKGRRTMRVFAHSCVIIMGYILFTDGFGLMRIFSIQVTPIVRLPMNIFYAVMPISGFFYMVIGLFELLRAFCLEEEEKETDQLVGID
jgi:TRAP-type C4-dicarboxylate transport system permease small subunit